MPPRLPFLPSLCPRAMRLVCLAAVGLAGCTVPDSPAPVDEPAAPSLSGAAAGYNVVLVSIDTLRADRLGAWGYATRETSPEMDRLVESGVRFANASAPRALTWPSLATVLTGLYPSAHGLLYNGYLLEDGQPSLPLLLRDAGYETAAFLANMCKANHQGWDRFECAGGVDRRVNREAIAWLRQRESDRPFLLWVHYFGPHSPYYAGGDLARTTFDPGYAGDLAPKKGVLDRIMTETQSLDEADQRHLDAIYDAAVFGTDHWIGELRDVLEQEAGLERTIVVFLSDHGEDLYQHHGYLYHACSVYESSLHVPLAVVAPSLLSGGLVHEGLVETVDVLPTLVDLLGLEPPSCLHGETLVPFLETPDSTSTAPGSRTEAAPTAYTEYGNAKTFTFRQGDWKLVVNPGGEAPICMEGVPEGFYPIAERELYDLAADPMEQQNLASTDPERASVLAATLDAYRGELCGVGPATPQAVDEETQRELEALGYVTRDEDG